MRQGRLLHRDAGNLSLTLYTPFRMAMSFEGGIELESTVAERHGEAVRLRGFQAVAEARQTSILVEGSSGERLEIELLPEGDGATFTYRSARPCEGLFPLTVRRLMGLVPEQVYVDGYQSWSPCFYLPAEAKQPLPRIRKLTHFLLSPHLPARLAPGTFWSDAPLVLCDRDGRSMLIGFITASRLLSSCRYRRRGGEPVLLSESHAPPAFPQNLSESVVVLAGRDPFALLARWAEITGERMGALTGAAAREGWCTWYHYYVWISEREFLRLLPGVVALPWTRRPLAQLDDGYEARVGEWRQANRRFPSGTGALPAAVEAAGGEAGIWLAPFITRDVRHPGVLTEENLKPVQAGVNPLWREKPLLPALGRYYALDLSHPATEDSLQAAFQGLRAEGYRYFKLDFLFAGLMHGERYRRQTPVEAYREAMRKIRAWTSGAELLGCGAPILPSVGLFEAMRIGTDVAPLRVGPENRLFGFPFGSGTKNALDSAIFRSYMHRRLWVNDPDCVLLRDRKTRLNEALVRAFATLASLTGGAFLISDNLDYVPPARRAWLRKLLPVAEEGVVLSEVRQGVFVLKKPLPFPSEGELHLLVEREGRGQEVVLRNPCGEGYAVFGLGARRLVGRREETTLLSGDAAEVIAWVRPKPGLTFLGDESSVHLGFDWLKEAFYHPDLQQAIFRFDFPAQRKHLLWFGLEQGLTVRDLRGGTMSEREPNLVRVAVEGKGSKELLVTLQRKEEK